jgi:hypothetical protein
MPSIARSTQRRCSVRKLLLGASLSSSLFFVGCAAKPHASPAATTASAATPAAADPRNKVIVHIVSQHQTITVTSSPNGLLYSLRDPQGHVQIAEATPEKFAELQPQLYHQIQNYIAVHADDAPIPSADIDAPIPTATVAMPDVDARRSPRGSAPSLSGTDPFKRTSERPFPTAREDAPE